MHSPETTISLVHAVCTISSVVHVVAVSRPISSFEIFHPERVGMGGVQRTDGLTLKYMYFIIVTIKSTGRLIDTHKPGFYTVQFGARNLVLYREVFCIVFNTESPFSDVPLYYRTKKSQYKLYQCSTPILVEMGLKCSLRGLKFLKFSRGGMPPDPLGSHSPPPPMKDPVWNPANWLQ